MKMKGVCQRIKSLILQHFERSALYFRVKYIWIFAPKCQNLWFCRKDRKRFKEQCRVAYLHTNVSWNSFLFVKKWCGKSWLFIHFMNVLLKRNVYNFITQPFTPKYRGLSNSQVIWRSHVTWMWCSLEKKLGEVVRWEDFLRYTAKQTSPNFSELWTISQYPTPYTP